MLHTPEQDILPQTHLLATEHPPFISPVIVSPMTSTSPQHLSSADVALQRTDCGFSSQDLTPTEIYPKGGEK